MGDPTTPPFYGKLKSAEYTKTGNRLRDHHDQVYAEIRKFNDEERNRARERAEKNKESSVDTDTNKLK